MRTGLPQGLVEEVCCRHDGKNSQWHLKVQIDHGQQTEPDHEGNGERRVRVDRGNKYTKRDPGPESAGSSELVDQEKALKKNAQGYTGIRS